MKRIGLSILVLLCLGGPALLQGCYAQRCVLFPRDFVRASRSPSLLRYPGMRRYWLSTSEGKVEAWFFPPPGAGRERRPAVLYAHGNGELIDGQRRMVRGYHRLGMGVMLCEFRGYGRSAGRPSQRRIGRDQADCYDLLRRQKEVDPRRIVFHGYSLGSGVVADLTRRRRPAALILQAPFTSVAALMAKYLIPRFCVMDAFDSEAAVKRYSGPVLILHGKRDRLIPYAHGQRLHRVARRGTLVSFPGGHNGFPTHSPRYWQPLGAFLRAHKILPVPPTTTARRRPR